MDLLDRVIVDQGTDAYVMYDSSENPDMRYLTAFFTNDPFVFFRIAGQRSTIIVSQMEYARAVRQSPLAVMTRAQAGLVEILKEEKNSWRAIAKMIAGQVKGTILVPPQFPLALARELKGLLTLVVDNGGLESLRSVKTGKEIRQIRKVQGVADSAMGLACSLIRKSKVKKGVLVLGGRSLTSGTIRAAIHKHFIDHGCTASDTIVSCGEDSAIPHITGSGPLYAGKPIVIDIFPKDERSGYYSDMTRTFSKEMPDADIADMYSAVSDARQMAAIQVREGAHGSEIHQAVVDFFKSRGYESSSTGFIHNLGHGVGLQVHEPPSLGPSGKDLVSGNVITIEPGLYYPGIGGVRIEDIGLVTKKGFRRFTKFPADLVL